MTTAEFDFPTIDAPPAEKAPTALAVTTPPDALVAVAPSIKDTVLAQFKAAEVAILALAEKYRAVAYDVASTKGMDAAKAARLELREKGRFAVQRAERSVKADVNDLKRVMADEVERLVAIVQPVEDAIDAQIKAEETRKAAAKAERDRIEAERVAGHEAGIAKVRGYLARCQGADMTAERIAKGIEMLAAVTFGPDWQEFAVPAANAQCETLDAMNTLHAHAVEREAEARCIEAARIERDAEQTRQAAENAHVAAELAEQRAKMAEQQAEMDRVAADLAEKARLSRAEDQRREAVAAAAEMEQRLRDNPPAEPEKPAESRADPAPALMLQDESRELSAALADAPHARLHATEAAAAIAAEASDSQAVDLFGQTIPEPIAEPRSELDPDLRNCRTALAQAIEMLDELICAHAPKRAAVTLFARVATIRDLGGLPRFTPTTTKETN